MSTAVVEGNLLTADYVLSGALPVPLPQVESNLHLCLDIPTFQLQLTVPITEVESDMESGNVTFTGIISNDAILILTVMGKLNREEDSFQIEQANVNMEHSVENARADFIVSTIRSSLTLAGDIFVRIPNVQMDITLRFDEPLLDIGQMLRRRQ